MPKKRKRNAGLGNVKKGHWRKGEHPPIASKTTSPAVIPFEWQVQDKINYCTIDLVQNESNDVTNNQSNNVENDDIESINYEDDTVAEHHVDTFRQKEYFLRLQA